MYCLHTPPPPVKTESSRLLSSFIEFVTDAPGLTVSVFVLMCAVSFIGSTMATTLGLGGGALVIAVMALFFPPAALIPLHGVVQLGSNIGRACLMRRQIVGHLIPVFALGSVVGALAGAKLVIALPVALLQMVLALFIVYAAWAPGFRGGKPSRRKFFAVGIMGSFVTMFVGATGPLIAPFAASISADRRVVVATHAALMSFQHGLKIIAFGVLGFAFWPYLPFLAAMTVFGFFGTLFGRNILNRLPERIFRIGFRITLSLLALRLFYGALAG